MFIQFEETSDDDLVLINRDHVAAVSIELRDNHPARVVLRFSGALSSPMPFYFGPAGMSKKEVEIRTRTLQLLLSGSPDRLDAWTKEDDRAVRAGNGTFSR